MIFKLFFIILISLNCLAFEKDLKTVNDKVPYEFQLLFDSLKEGTKLPSEKILFIGLCKDIDSNLGFLSKEHIYMLMKTEVIKNVLEHKFSKIRSLDVNLALIQKLESDFKNKESKLNRFSQWIWRSIIAELNHRKSMGLVSEKNFSATHFSGKKAPDAKRFEKYLKYIIPWMDKMLTLETEEFNELSREVSWIILERINERSILYRKFSTSAEGDTKTSLINIPQKLLDLNPQDIKNMQEDIPVQSLQEKSQAERIKAQEIMDKTSPEDLSPLSDELNKALEKKL